jgi:hypothetical protein
MKFRNHPYGKMIFILLNFTNMDWFLLAYLSPPPPPHTALVGRGRFSVSLSVGLLGQVISSLQGLYLNTGQHKQKKHTHTHTYTPNIHALSGIPTHDHSIRASKDSSRLRLFGYCDRRVYLLWNIITNAEASTMLNTNAQCNSPQ